MHGFACSTADIHGSVCIDRQAHVIFRSTEPLGAPGLPCAGIEVSALISPGDYQGKTTTAFLPPTSSSPLHSPPGSLYHPVYTPFPHLLCHLSYICSRLSPCRHALLSFPSISPLQLSLHLSHITSPPLTAATFLGLASTCLLSGWQN